tara:strand:- start:787 stop:1008 length:222 start_codon:yes stop_codon:yes gene_type:complete
MIADPQQGLLLAIGRLEGKVDSILATMRQHGEEIERIDNRVRKLEQSKAWMLGAAAVAGAMSSYFFRFIGVPK